MDPAVVVAEWAMTDSSGPPAARHVSNIQVSTVRDGNIVASRDHHNRLVLASESGGERLIASRGHTRMRPLPVTRGGGGCWGSREVVMRSAAQ
jgi:hypothetical protein